MRKYLIFGGAILVLCACGQSVTAPAPVHRHMGAKASIVCPPGYTGMVIRTGNEEQEVCVPENGG
jgi:hypothetical protein